MESTNIGYKGNVRISKYRKGRLIKRKTLHNAGTWNLFNLLCTSLDRNQEVQPYEKPTYLDIMCARDKNNNPINIEDATIGSLHSILASSLPFISTQYIDTSNPEESSQSVGGTFATQDSTSGSPISSYITFRSLVTLANYNESANPDNASPLFFVLKSGNSAGESNSTILAVVPYVDEDGKLITCENFSIADDEVYIVDWTLTLSNVVSSSSQS